MLNGEYTAGRNDIRKVDIRLMYNGGITNMLGSREGQTKGLEAVKKPEFIVTHAHFLNTTAQYSDIVLPITTQWERDGLVQDDGNREVIFFGSRAVDPLGEARDDMWIAREIGAGLGIERAFIEPVSKEQQLFNAVSGAQVINAAGDGYEPLVTITEKDLDDLGVHGKPQKGKISYNEFRANGLYQVSRSPDDNLMHIPFKDFRNDPVMHPLQTPSGRLEIHCRELEQFVQGCGWSTIKPFPAYLPAEEGYEGTLSDQTGIRRGKYTLQFYSVHYPRRAGTTYDNVSWLREAWPHEFYMNTLDAEQRGISDGDTIKVRSRNGCIIRQVKVTPRMRPGVTCLGAGAWAHFDHTLKADLSGSANILTGAVRTGQGTSGWNTVLVEVEKLEYPLPPDHLIPSEALI
jgi:anaerobic dimethyl sulfoxide reductase subunit A